MLCGTAAGWGPVRYESLGIDIPRPVLCAESACIEIFLNLLPGGQQTVLIALGLPPLLVPPENSGVLTAPDAVHVVHTPGGDVPVSAGTAACVNVQRVQPQSQLQIIGPGGADAAQVLHALQGLVHPQHPGDAALSGHLVDNVRPGDAQLRLSRLQVVEHHRHRTVVLILRLHGLPRQRIGAGRNVGFGLRFRFRLLHRRRRRWGLRLRRRLLSAARQGAGHPYGQKQGQSPSFHK